MADQSVGPLTIMFTDLEGSTNLATERGDDVAQRIHEIQDRLVREQLAQFDGHVDHSTGDGVLAIFRSTRKAIACAVAIQQWIDRHNAHKPEEAFRLRIGLNAGEVLRRKEEVFGAAINAASRITEKAKGGEILVSDVVKQLAGSASGVSFADRGRLRLKGFPERWHLFQVVVPDQETEADVVAPPGDVFVGRDQERLQIRAALEEAKGGSGRLVLLVGDAGIGKTRLADELSHDATAQGALVAWGRGWEGGGAPAYWPWIQVFRVLVEKLGPEEMLERMGAGAGYVAHLVPEIGRLLSHTAPVVRATEQDRFALFDAVVKAMRAAARDQLLVVVLDDLHAADEASLHLLHFLARGLRAEPILVVGTYIDAEVRRNPPAARVFAALGREARVLPLTGVSPDAVAAYYEGITGKKPAKNVSSELHALTEGNPLLLDEAVRAVAGGGLRRPDMSLGFRVPAGGRDYARRRLLPLSEEAARVLAIASVIGREFNFNTLRELCGLDQDALLSIISEAIAAGVVQEISHVGRYSFTHIVIRETLYEELTVGDRMRLHRDVGETLEKIYGSDDTEHLDELAHHFFKAAQAGDVAKSLDYSVRAAEKATMAMAYEEAIRLYQRALRAAELGTTGRKRRAEIQDKLSRVEARSAETATQFDATSPATTGDGEGVGVFLRAGEFWTVSFEGEEIRLKDGKGPRYLVQLLKNPGKEVHVLDLAALVEGRSGGGSSRRTSGRTRAAAEAEGRTADDAGEILDAEAKAAYRRRIKELDEELAEAEDFNDPERAAKAREEREALIDQLAAGVGLGGRDRKAASRAEAARSSITKAVKNTLVKLQVHHPRLGAHLTATVKTGVYCSYTPDPRAPIRWRT